LVVIFCWITSVKNSALQFFNINEFGLPVSFMPCSRVFKSYPLAFKTSSTAFLLDWITGMPALLNALSNLSFTSLSSGSVSYPLTKIIPAAPLSRAGRVLYRVFSYLQKDYYAGL